MCPRNSINGVGQRKRNLLQVNKGRFLHLKLDIDLEVQLDHLIDTRNSGIIFSGFILSIIFEKH